MTKKRFEIIRVILIVILVAGSGFYFGQLNGINRTETKWNTTCNEKLSTGLLLGRNHVLGGMALCSESPVGQTRNGFIECVLDWVR